MALLRGGGWAALRGPVWLGAVVSLVFAGVGKGSPTGPPRNAIAWWWFEPAPGGAAAPELSVPDAAAERNGARAWVRGAVGAGWLSEADSERWVDVLLGVRAALVRPHTVCLLSLKTDPGAAAGQARMSELMVAVEVRAIRGAGTRERLVRAVRAAAGSGGGSERAVALPGGLTGAVYAEPKWPSWREVSWCAPPDDERFMVGFGHGALERWLGRPGAAAEGGVIAEWEAHDRSARQLPDAGQAVFEAFADVNALRVAWTEGFAGGVAGRLAAAWGVSNARALMLRGSVAPARAGYDGPPLVVLHATWSARSESPGVVHEALVSEAGWTLGPGGVPPLPARPGAYAIVLRADPNELLHVALATYRAVHEPREAERLAREHQGWELRHRGVLGRLVGAASGVVVLSADRVGGGVLPVPMSVCAPLHEGADARRVSADLKEVLSVPGDRVVYDAGAGVWSWRANGDASVRLGTWGLATGGGAQAVAGGLDSWVDGAWVGRVMEGWRKWARKGE